MKLYYSPASPYVRNVLAALHHHDLVQEVEITPISPVKDRSELIAVNPLGKVPALQLKDGEILFDSAVIVHYIDQIGHGSGLFEDEDLGPHTISCLFALSNGVLDAAVSWVMEHRLPEQEQSPFHINRWEENIHNSLKLFSTKLPLIENKQIMPIYSFAVTLDYLQFRLPHLKWAKDNPALFNWYTQQQEHTFLQQTDPRNAA